MMSSRRSPGQNGGYTLIEVAITVSMAVLVMQGVFNVMFQWEKLFTEQVKQFTLDQRAETILNRLTEELRSAHPPSLLPAVLSNSSTIQFQRVTGFSGGAVELGPLVTIGFVLAPGETANGADQNGNGLADEGFITMTEGTTPLVRLVSDVMGLRFNSTASGLSFSVDLGLVDGKQNVTVKTFTQNVAFRNPD